MSDYPIPGVVVVRVPDVGPNGEGIKAAVDAIREHLPDGFDVWAALDDPPKPASEPHGWQWCPVCHHEFPHHFEDCPSLPGEQPGGEGR